MTASRARAGGVITTELRLDCCDDALRIEVVCSISLVCRRFEEGVHASARDEAFVRGRGEREICSAATSSTTTVILKSTRSARRARNALMADHQLVCRDFRSRITASTLPTFGRAPRSARRTASRSLERRSRAIATRVAARRRVRTDRNCFAASPTPPRRHAVASRRHSICRRPCARERHIPSAVMCG